MLDLMNAHGLVVLTGLLPRCNLGVHGWSIVDYIAVSIDVLQPGMGHGRGYC